MSKQDILNAPDKEIISVDTPEWPSHPVTHLCTITGAVRDAFEDETVRVVGKKVEFNNQNARARLLVRCICDDQGNLLFTPADADALGMKSGKVLARLWDAARKLNGMNNADAELDEKN